MTTLEKIKKVTELVNRKMVNGSASVTYTGKNKAGIYEDMVGGGRTFIFSNVNGEWTLYQGCELIIGDTALMNCVTSMLDICGEYKPFGM